MRSTDPSYSLTDLCRTHRTRTVLAIFTFKPFLFLCCTILSFSFLILFLWNILFAPFYFAIIKQYIEKCKLIVSNALMQNPKNPCLFVKHSYMVWIYLFVVSVYYRNVFQVIIAIANVMNIWYFTIKYLVAVIDLFYKATRKEFF